MKEAGRFRIRYHHVPAYFSKKEAPPALQVSEPSSWGTPQETSSSGASTAPVNADAGAPARGSGGTRGSDLPSATAPAPGATAAGSNDGEHAGSGGSRETASRDKSVGSVRTKNGLQDSQHATKQARRMRKGKTGKGRSVNTMTTESSSAMELDSSQPATEQTSAKVSGTVSEPPRSQYRAPVSVRAISFGREPSVGATFSPTGIQRTRPAKSNSSTTSRRSERLKNRPTTTQTTKETEIVEETSEEPLIQEAERRRDATSSLSELTEVPSDNLETESTGNGNGKENRLKRPREEVSVFGNYQAKRRYTGPARVSMRSQTTTLAPEGRPDSLQPRKTAAIKPRRL